MASILYKYTIFLLNLLLFSQAQLENKSKILVLSCSKLLNQKFKDQPKSEDFTKMMLSCFIKISQDQAQKISDRKESDSLPLKPEEINELFNIDNLKGIPEEEIKSNSELMNKFIQEIEDSEKNIRRLVDMDNDNLADNKDNIANEDVKDNNDNDRDNNANNENNNDNGDEIKDDDDDNEMDSNYYGDDDYMNDYNYENMYDDYDGAYDDYYDDEYWKNGNYDYGNMSEDDYSNMYGNDYGYNYNENKSYKEMIMENKGPCIFIVCLVIMIILIAIFGKDYEDTQTLEIDPNKNKQQ